MMRIKFLLFLLLSAVFVYGQNEMTILTGRVVDRQSGRVLAHVSVSSPNGGQQTVTNDDGEFLLKTPGRPAYIEFSHLGYHTRRVSIGGQTENLTVRLVTSAIQLDEVVVMMNDPMDVLRAAISKIPDNYSMQPSMMHCFYRETAQKGSRFIAISEAITDMYKTAYSHGVRSDAVQIVKGRRLLSTRAKDTLGVKLMGGPVIPIMLDVVKNSELLLNERELQLYNLKMEMPERIDYRAQFVISFVPQYYMDRPLYYGKFYIDQETMAFTRVELHLDMDDRAKATDYMLVRKPLGLRFNPRELTTTINYQTTNNVTHISYVRNVMRFKCDWKRHLFSSAYTLTTEIVVTGLVPAAEVHAIRNRDSFGTRDYFYDKVSFFDEPDFWGAYNIIEPTESLEHAIDKLKKTVISQ
jgi:hypothetical protein